VRGISKSLRIRSVLGNVYRVDGNKIRKKHTDFIGGGHKAVYSFIPGKEVWVEKMAAGAIEERYLLAHEMTEILLMKVHKWKYDRAHNAANKIEKKLRKSGCPDAIFLAYVKRYFPRASAATATATGALLAKAYRSYR
jgi:hypothetical protein